MKTLLTSRCVNQRGAGQRICCCFAKKFVLSFGDYLLYNMLKTKFLVFEKILRNQAQMHIQRVQVDEGFLDGLDVTFTSGLNVIIGSRGTGKTSLIEIIRFCLDASSTTTETTRRSRDHALSILGSGQVTVTPVSYTHLTLPTSDLV